MVSEYHNDHLGRPLALSDKDGVVVAEWKRDPFGMVVSKTGSVDDNNMSPGQFWDADAGLAYNWNRWYSPEIGRYVEVDPDDFAGRYLKFSRAFVPNPLVQRKSNGKFTPEQVNQSLRDDFSKRFLPQNNQYYD